MVSEWVDCGFRCSFRVPGCCFCWFFWFGWFCREGAATLYHGDNTIMQTLLRSDCFLSGVCTEYSVRLSSKSRASPLRQGAEMQKCRPSWPRHKLGRHSATYEVKLPSEAGGKGSNSRNSRNSLGLAHGSIPLRHFTFRHRSYTEYFRSRTLMGGWVS